MTSLIKYSTQTLKVSDTHHASARVSTCIVTFEQKLNTRQMKNIYCKSFNKSAGNLIRAKRKESCTP